MLLYRKSAEIENDSFVICPQKTTYSDFQRPPRKNKHLSTIYIKLLSITPFYLRVGSIFVLLISVFLSLTEC